MIVLVLIGLLGGLITAVSPCVLPVLPVVFLAGGPGAATGAKAQADPEGDSGQDDPSGRRNRRPYAVVAGLVVSFSFFTLAGTTIISALGLPDGILRYVGLAMLVLLGLGLVFPPLERLLERPFARLPQRRVNKEGSAFALGLGLGLLYVPCAGPVLAAITVAGAQGRISTRIVALTVAFAVGTAVPLLVFALAGRGVARRVGAFRRRARVFRVAGGAVMIVLACALAFNLTDVLQRALPDYTAAAQNKVEDSQTARQQLSGLTDNSNKLLSRCEDGVDQLRDCGPAPAFAGISQWLNTPGGRPLSIKELHGKVVLVDFWTYSCINCQRALPNVEAWDRAYRADGLQVIGVHSPEFTFEKSASNVADAVKKLGVRYPVALDNQLTTWNNYRNQYWPAQYLIDSDGTVRYLTFGEGRYSQTEDLIRTLLQQAHPHLSLPPKTTSHYTPVPTDTTPETYLSTQRIDRYVGTPLVEARPERYHAPAQLPSGGISLNGTWTTTYEDFTAGPGARIDLSFQAAKVYLVLGGHGPVKVLLDGRLLRTVQVSGAPTLYTLADLGGPHHGLLQVEPAQGVQAYDFTFG
ncbi:cytochrome c biogenesis protein DipZ [Streptantibioticus parmotrematis]|uniref:cytochrome c biogenesis protein DipZ n=1 Tax=Streptantibioticus parmotrematis TaxID=2873249 RepID=UPI0033C36724